MQRLVRFLKVGDRLKDESGQEFKVVEASNPQIQAISISNPSMGNFRSQLLRVEYIEGDATE